MKENMKVTGYVNKKDFEKFKEIQQVGRREFGVNISFCSFIRNCLTSMIEFQFNENDDLKESVRIYIDVWSENNEKDKEKIKTKYVGDLV